MRTGNASSYEPTVSLVMQLLQTGRTIHGDRLYECAETGTGRANAWCAVFAAIDIIQQRCFALSVRRFDGENDGQAGLEDWTQGEREGGALQG